MYPLYEKVLPCPIPDCRLPASSMQRYPAARRTLIDGWGVDTHFMLHAFVALAVS